MKKIQNLWKKWNKDYKIEIRSIESVSPYILIINFKADSKPYYMLMEGNYLKHRKRFLERANEVKKDNELISFTDYLNEIGLLIPVEDVVLHNIKKWKYKFTSEEYQNKKN